MADQSYTVVKEHEGKTVAAFLRTQLPGASWSDVRRLINGRQLRVNGVLCVDDARRLRAGDRIGLHQMPSDSPLSAGTLAVLHHDEHLIVVDKPAGLETERRLEEQGWPARKKALQPVLVELLEGKGLRPLPVHRLDRDTSGLMVYALTGFAREKLVAQFAAHSIERRYLAVAIGKMHDREVRNWIVRDRGDGVRGCVDTPIAGAQEAISRFRVREIIRDRFSLIECELETGRTHQIRLHLSWLGHPVCGEKLYLSPAPGKQGVLDESNAPRQSLHAAILGFTHPKTGKPMRFEQEWPEDLARWLKSLRSEA